MRDRKANDAEVSQKAAKVWVTILQCCIICIRNENGDIRQNRHFGSPNNNKGVKDFGLLTVRHFVVRCK